MPNHDRKNAAFRAAAAAQAAYQEQDLFAGLTPAPLPQAALDDAQRLACLRLIRSDNVGPVTFRELINHYGGAREALDALPKIYERGGSARRRSSRHVRICPESRALAELDAAKRIGAQPVFTIEPDYPAALAHIESPPPLLYVKGDLNLLQRPAVAIVGSRNASASGHKLTRQFAAHLGRAGFIITSGLARGIDGTAHDAALETGTIAVVAGGLDVIYPPEHEDLHGRIGKAGCLVSEMPPGFKPRGKDFPRRNRIIAGMSLGTIIIEAARRSGTLITARMAAELGREVFAVPGHPLDPRAEGTNHLLQNGASIAIKPEDVIEALRPMLRGGAASGLAGNRRTGSGAGNGAGGLRETPGAMEGPAFAAAGSPEGVAPEATAGVERAPEATSPLATAGASGPTADLVPGDTAPAGFSIASPPAADDVDQPEAGVLVADALGPAPVNIDEIARATGLGIREVQIAVMEMDLAGRIERHGQQLISLRPEKA